MASGRLPPVLALEIAAAWRPAEGHAGNSRIDSPLGTREYPLGRTKIYGELQKLGFVLSERTVARYLSRTQRRSDPGKKWLAFLHNHREAIVAFDFYTVPTATFRVLYWFFVIEHERRRILHFNVTRHPSSDWVVQQLRETFAEAGPYYYAILDHDSIFNDDVSSFLETTGLKANRTSIHSHGRTDRPKDGLEVVGARSSTISSR